MKPLRVLGFCGSPRKGNTLFLLEKALEAAKRAADGVEVTSVSLRGKVVAPCNSCFWCVTHGGECKIGDDFQELIEKWLSAHVILYAFPVYHMSIPGQLKCFIDRLGQSGS
jgi:multimeric flavodoxin WrbA